MKDEPFHVNWPDPFSVEDAIELGVLHKLEITMDGEKCQDVVAFSVKEGWVEYYPKGEDGLYLWEGQEVKRSRKLGRVEVTL